MKEQQPSLVLTCDLARYDGVWSKDVAKCGLYGSIETDGDCGLPGLQLLEPMAVLEEQAYKLQVTQRGGCMSL